MALQLDQIRASAERVAASHGLDLVDLEFAGSGKHRSLRIFVEKDEAGRARLKEQAAAREAAQEASAAPDPSAGPDPSADPDLEPLVDALPVGVAVEVLSGVTHEDCEQFARDFGTLLDVEDLIPGAEYTLEVSSPGLERKLHGPADYRRFQGLLVKLQTFTPVSNNRHFAGRLTGFDGAVLTLDLGAVKQKGKNKKAAAAAAPTVSIDLTNVEKANLVAEI